MPVEGPSVFHEADTERRLLPERRFYSACLTFAWVDRQQWLVLAQLNDGTREGLTTIGS